MRVWLNLIWFWRCFGGFDLSVDRNLRNLHHKLQDSSNHLYIVTDHAVDISRIQFWPDSSKMSVSFRRFPQIFPRFFPLSRLLPPLGAGLSPQAAQRLHVDGAGRWTAAAAGGTQPGALPGRCVAWMAIVCWVNGDISYRWFTKVMIYPSIDV